MTDRLLSHIEDPATDERLERIWQNVASRSDEYRPSSPRKTVALAFGGFAVVAGVALGWFFGAPLHERQDVPVAVSAPAPIFEAGAALTTATDEMSVSLEDGSKLTLAPRSRVAMQDSDTRDVALNLTEGRVACQVAKNQGRTFSVLAGDVVVRVVGTSFSVERIAEEKSEKVAVDVTEGVVEVVGPDGVVKRLGAGESWSVRVPTEEVVAANEAEEIVAKRQEEKVAPRAAVASSVDKAKRDLFAEARGKRNAGDAAAAARLYQSFLEANPSDVRAGVAALELGRLRMDQLGDPAGAIGPLTRAASGVGGGLGDDALARLVQARAQLGQKAACKSAKTRYLTTYPEGVHVESVRAACP